VLINRLLRSHHLCLFRWSHDHLKLIGIGI
jgi:hypothetical protein